MGLLPVHPGRSPHASPHPWACSGPALVHQPHDTCATLRLPGVQLLQGLFPLGNGITDLEEAKDKSQKSTYEGHEVQAGLDPGRAAGQSGVTVLHGKDDLRGQDPRCLRFLTDLA